MPELSFSQALTANQLGFNPAAGWQFEQLPWQAAVKVLARATGVSTRLTLYSGSTTIKQRSPIQGGGTAGTTPAELSTPPVLFIGEAGDTIIFQIDEVSGLTPTVDGQITVEPTGD